MLHEEIRVLQGQYKALQQRYDKLDQSFQVTVRLRAARSLRRPCCLLRQHVRVFVPQKQAITVDEINGENEMLTAKVCQLTKALSQKTKELQQLTTVSASPFGSVRSFAAVERLS